MKGKVLSNLNAAIRGISAKLMLKFGKLIRSYKNLTDEDKVTVVDISLRQGFNCILVHRKEDPCQEKVKYLIYFDQNSTFTKWPFSYKSNQVACLLCKKHKKSSGVHAGYDGIARVVKVK
jgi:hypothetical protein